MSAHDVHAFFTTHVFYVCSGIASHTTATAFTVVTTGVDILTSSIPSSLLFSIEIVCHLQFVT